MPAAAGLLRYSVPGRWPSRLRHGPGCWKARSNQERPRSPSTPAGGVLMFSSSSPVSLVRPCPLSANSVQRAGRSALGRTRPVGPGLRIAEKIRVEIESVSIGAGTDVPQRVTVSGGCAQVGEDLDVANALTLADVWLSQAKRAGRNQIVGLYVGHVREIAGLALALALHSAAARAVTVDVVSPAETRPDCVARGRPPPGLGPCESAMVRGVISRSSAAAAMRYLPTRQPGRPRSLARPQPAPADVDEGSARMRPRLSWVVSFSQPGRARTDALHFTTELGTVISVPVRGPVSCESRPGCQVPPTMGRTA